MARFNTRTVTGRTSTRTPTPFTPIARGDTRNIAGGEAFTVDPRYELAMAALTSFVKDAFYRTDKAMLTRLAELVNRVDPAFTARTAVYVRREANMRSISHVLAALLAGDPSRGTAWGRRFYDRVIVRVDDIAEILAAYAAINPTARREKPSQVRLTNAMKVGLRAALGRFDGYQLARYRGEGSEFPLVDIVNMLHPEPTERNREALSALVKDELRNRNTWEAKMSAVGQVAETEEDRDSRMSGEWRELIGLTLRGEKGGLGYFAALRNIRNIMEVAPAAIPDLITLLTHENLVRGSRVLPFRAITAYREIEKVPGDADIRGAVLEALSNAVDMLLVNIPRFSGATLIAVDRSGSMRGQPSEIAGVFAAALYKAQVETSDRVDMMVFGTTARYFSPNARQSTLTMAESIAAISMGGTDFKPIFRLASRAYDRIIILSDMQGWIGFDAPGRELAMYATRTGTRPKIYSFDLSGLGTVQFPARDIFLLAGWSDRTLDVMGKLEQDPDALITEIEKVSL